MRSTPIVQTIFEGFCLDLKMSNLLKPLQIIFPVGFCSEAVFCKKGVLKYFAKFTGKHLCQSLFFNNVAGLRPVTLLKKRFWHRCFPVYFAKILRTTYIAQLRWLFLPV